MSSDKSIELEKSYSNVAIASKLRRLADAVEAGKGFQIQIDNERIYVPADVYIEFEYEVEGNEYELEIEMKWKKDT